MRFAVTVLVDADSREQAIRNHCDGEFHAVAVFNIASRRAPIRAPSGPGTELKKIIYKLGFKPKAGCKCGQHIMEMNTNGPDWCEQNIDTITGWLREEAVRAGYPFIESGARLIIRRAIRNSKRAGL